MRGRERSTRWLWVACGVCLLLSALAGWGRQALVRAFFVDGNPGVAPVLTQPDTDDLEPPAAADRVRVVLLDGLGTAAAQAMPEYQRRCAQGLTLLVDNGFPTVSLPVQHVLWTGQTQMQAGVMYRIPALERPPREALPYRIPGSVGVAQSHRAIVQSFGFTSTWSAPKTVVSPRSAFAARAREAVEGPAPLAFIHVLAIDEAGHAHGADSVPYQAAVEAADQLLATLVAADPPSASSRWFVLSDHGHRSAGGHGGPETAIRIVRACVFGGPGPEFRGVEGRLQLVDLHRLLAESVGVPMGAQSRGRPLAFAIRHPEWGRTLPTPSLTAWIFAVVALLIGGSVMAWSMRDGWTAVPWWMGLAYLGQVWMHGVPTLSVPSIYALWGRDMVVAMLPALVVVGIVALRGSASGRLRGLIAHLALPWSFALATLVSCGAINFAWNATPGPPLIPWHTAHASWLLCVCFASSLVMAVAVAVRAIGIGVTRARVPGYASARDRTP